MLLSTCSQTAVRDVLTKERVQVGPIVLVFGLNPGQGAVSTSLTRVRGADGDIQGSVGVAQGRGEDVCGPQVRARDETGNLHFSSVIALLRCCMQKGRNGIVSPCGLPKGAAGGVRCARIQNARVAGGASDGFHGASATQTKANRINILIGFQSQAVTRVEPPQPGVVYRGVAKLRKTRASSPRPFIFMHLQQALADPGVEARSDDALNLGPLPRVRMLLIAITVIRRDATSMARSRGRLILHRSECTHGGVFEAQYGFFHVFSSCFKTHKHTNTHQTHTTTTNNNTTTTTTHTHHTTQHTTSHGDRQ